ncbi:hypothetical protein KK499_07175 [Bacillus vallismortis]|nr:hypothetical protein [Bacillus vallismortis]
MHKTNRERPPRDIFDQCGFDEEILGIKRIQSSGKRWREAYRKNGVLGLRDTRSESLEDWKSRFNPGGNLSVLDSQVLDIIKKAYNLGMVNKDNMLLRNEAINAYRNSI